MFPMALERNPGHPLRLTAASGGRTGYGSILGGVVVLLLVTGCTANGLGEERIGDPEAVAWDELDSAVTKAVETLMDSPGIEVVEERVHEDVNPSAQWIDYRADGTHARVEIGEQPDSVFGAGGVRPLAMVVLGHAVYTAAGENATWVIDEMARPRGLQVLPTVVPLDSMPHPGFFDNDREVDDFDITRQSTVDGGTVWSATPPPSNEPTASQIWSTHPDGHLRAYSIAFENLEDLGLPFPARLDTTYTALQNPSPLPVPEPGSELDYDIFDLPPDFPIDQ